MRNTFVCEVCGTTHSVTEEYILDNTSLCPACLEEETTLCSYCGERIWRGDNSGDELTPLCQYCYDEHFETCEECGRVIQRDDVWRDESTGDPLCYRCFCHCEDTRKIHEYSYKPEPIFYGEGKRYFGVELEIDQGGQDQENAEELLEIAGGKDFFYCKQDGSLHNGFEIVTHPMTLAFRQETMPWRAVLRAAADMGYRSHQASTCGLHIHINRTAFGETEEMQDEVIARILYLVERYWEEFLKFSRRTQAQLEHWTARYGYKAQPAEILGHAKTGNGKGRYSCVNLQNQDTIELRIFRGTLKYNTLAATLQMADWICTIALALSDEEIKNLSWADFVEGIPEDICPELVQYLKERKLYINEPVTAEEEL